MYLRPVSGCINAGCVAVVAALGCGLGLLTFVLLLANSKRIVWGISGSKRTPCCKLAFKENKKKMQMWVVSFDFSYGFCFFLNKLFYRFSYFYEIIKKRKCIEKFYCGNKVLFKNMSQWTLLRQNYCDMAFYYVQN